MVFRFQIKCFQIFLDYKIQNRILHTAPYMHYKIDCSVWPGIRASSMLAMSPTSLSPHVVYQCWRSAYVLYLGIYCIEDWNLKGFLGLRGLVNCLVKIANDLDEEMSTEPRTNKSSKSIGDILLENGHICNSPSGKRFLRTSMFTDDNEI